MTIFHDSRAALGHPFWWDDAGPRPDLPDAPPARVDLVVVGAGFTGLSAALAARDAGADVAVIDAGWPGAGASSRNGGMFGAHPRLPFDTLAKQFGESVATGVTRESLAAFQHTKGLIDNERIACDFEVTGRLLLAWTRAHHEGQKRLAAAVSKAGGGTAELVPKDALQAEIATDRYFGGLRFPDHAALQPRKFHDGLLAAALKRDIPVIADCPALRVQRTIDGFRVETPKGEIRARRLVAATNGYTDGAFQRLRARVFPLPSFLIATEPLSPNLVAALAPGRRMYVETRARHSYYRVSPDGSRILFGGRASMRPIDLRTAAARLRATMCDIWPDLEDTRLTHVWTGNTGFSFNQMPHVGEMDGVHFAMGYSGSGVAMAPYLGMKAAYRALGDPRGETAFADTHFTTRWFHAARPWFLYPADLWFRYGVDAGENRAADADRSGSFRD